MAPDSFSAALAKACDAFEQWCEEFDPDQLTPDELAVLIEDLAAIRPKLDQLQRNIEQSRPPEAIESER